MKLPRPPKHPLEDRPPAARAVHRHPVRPAPLPLRFSPRRLPGDAGIQTSIGVQAPGGGDRIPSANRRFPGSFRGFHPRVGIQPRVALYDHRFRRHGPGGFGNRSRRHGKPPHPAGGSAGARSGQRDEHPEKRDHRDQHTVCRRADPGGGAAVGSRAPGGPAFDRGCRRAPHADLPAPGAGRRRRTFTRAVVSGRATCHPAAGRTDRRRPPGRRRPVPDDHCCLPAATKSAC